MGRLNDVKLSRYDIRMQIAPGNHNLHHLKIAHDIYAESHICPVVFVQVCSWQVLDEGEHQVAASQIAPSFLQQDFLVIYCIDVK
jgi:hypothetical protein